MVKYTSVRVVIFKYQDTKMNFEFTNDFSNLTDSLSLKVVHGTLFCIAEFIAFTCYTGLIYYEVSHRYLPSKLHISVGMRMF